MKNFIIIILLLIVLCIGINVGSGSDKTKSEIIKNKIEDFESGVENENKIYNTIQPTIINEIAIKCNDKVDTIIKKILKKIIS